MIPAAELTTFVLGMFAATVAAALRFVHRWAGYATGIFWLISNIASEIGSRIPRT